MDSLMQSIAGKSVKTYASNTSTVAIETATISEGAEGTALDASDGSVANLNHIQRAMVGSSNWRQSSMRQYLNSSAAAGDVWTPKTKFDRPPDWAASTAGFLDGMDEDFLAVVGEVDKVTILNTVTDGGGSETNTEKFFLLSRSEVYGGKENGISEEEPYPYYANNSDLSVPGTAVDANRVKYLKSGTLVWMLRSPSAKEPGCSRGVAGTGGIYSFACRDDVGVCPVCCIV